MPDGTDFNLGLERKIGGGGGCFDNWQTDVNEINSSQQKSHKRCNRGLNHCTNSHLALEWTQDTQNSTILWLISLFLFQKYFDSGDYNMAKAAINNPKKPLPPQEKMLLQESIGEGIPTPEDLPPRKPSIVQSKLASGALSWLDEGGGGKATAIDVSTCASDVCLC